MTGRHRCTLTIALALMAVISPVYAISSSKLEEVEWTWEVRPLHVDVHLPNVLLQGDSISRNYYPEVQKQLTGRANVYLMASSISVGDPRLPRAIKEFAAMEGVRFQVVHFNNGMHGWNYSEEQYRQGFPEYLKALHTIAPNAAFVWASTTPVRKPSVPGPTNDRVDARNAIALGFVRGMLVDDQHGLMAKHEDLHEDDVHYNKQGSDLGGDQAARLIEQALSKGK